MSNSIWKDVTAQGFKTGSVYVGHNLLKNAIMDAKELQKIAEDGARKCLKVAFSKELAEDLNAFHDIGEYEETDMDLKSIIKELEDIDASIKPKSNREKINDERRHIEWNKKSVSSTTNNIVGKQSFNDSFPNGAIRNLETQNAEENK